MRIRHTVFVTAATAVTALALAACTSTTDSGSHKPTRASTAPGGSDGSTGAGSTPGPDRSTAQAAAGIPPEPTGAERAAVLGAVRDVDARLTADEDRAIDAARNQCGALAGGAANPDHAAALRFSYDGITLSDDDGSHLNIGLRNTLCPQP